MSSPSDKVELVKRARMHGYTRFPTSEIAFRDAVAIEKEGENVDRLVEFAAMLELHEKETIPL